jgi:hypothetical protein
MPTISWDRLAEIEFEFADLLERIEYLEKQLEHSESLNRYYQSGGQVIEPDNTSVQP